MGGDSTRPEHRGNQNRSRSSLVSSIHRKIGTIRRECLDRLLFWSATDLEVKLDEIPTLLQRVPHAWRIERAVTEFQPPGADKLCFIPLAEALSRALPNADCCVTVRIRHQDPKGSGQPLFGGFEGLFSHHLRSVPRVPFEDAHE